MNERDIKKLASNIYRLADFLQETKDKDLIKKYPLLYENSKELFENECERLEEWITKVSGDTAEEHKS